MPRTYNVVSPHLDDAALSCALFLAANPGSRLITVFTGGPASVSPLTTWDRAARYFKDGADVMAIRRGEDTKAAALVRADALHLPYWDRQYRNQQYGYDGPAEAELAPAIAADLLAQAAKQARPWLIPLGLGHPDHRLTTDAALLYAATQPGPTQPGPTQPPEIYVYADLPYAAEDPAGVAERKRYLAERGFALTGDAALEFATDRRLKAAVLRCHTSQRRVLRRRARTALRTPEQIWRLLPAAAARLPAARLPAPRLPARGQPVDDLARRDSHEQPENRRPVPVPAHPRPAVRPLGPPGLQPGQHVPEPVFARVPVAQHPVVDGPQIADPHRGRARPSPRDAQVLEPGAVRPGFQRGDLA